MIKRITLEHYFYIICVDSSVIVCKAYICELTVKPSNKERKEEDFFKSGIFFLGISSGESFTLPFNKRKKSHQERWMMSNKNSRFKKLLFVNNKVSVHQKLRKRRFLPTDSFVWSFQFARMDVKVFLLWLAQINDSQC